VETPPGRAPELEPATERHLRAPERPLRALLVRLWHESCGLPTWNPLINMGKSLAANPHAAVFHPLSWLFLILPRELAFKLQVLVPLPVSFAGKVSLLRTLGRNWPAAVPHPPVGSAVSRWTVHRAFP